MKTTLFKKILLDDNANSIEENVSQILGKKLLYFTLKWTEGAPVLLYQLNFKLNGDTKTIDALNDNAIKDTDGEITILLGQFNSNDKIVLTIGIKPFSKIPRATIWLSQTNPNILLKQIPQDNFKLLEEYEDWTENITLKIT